MTGFVKPGWNALAGTSVGPKGPPRQRHRFVPTRVAEKKPEAHPVQAPAQATVAAPPAAVQPIRTTRRRAGK